jgi:YHS domain-containing protein
MSRFSRRAVLAGAAALLAGMQFRLVAADAAADKRVGLQGYDPVAYFTKGRPEKGAAEFSASFDGATYWFNNAEHRALFVADPDRYAPQFGGFCAINIGRGEKYEADPDAWVIADGKLYVFGSKEGVPVFRQQAPGIVAAASHRWPEMRRTQ